MEDRQFTGASFYQFLADGKLMGSECESCGALHLPPRALCPACHTQDMAWREMSGEGRLLAFTSVHIGPAAMIEAGYDRERPYCAGIVQLAEGPAISAQILGVDPSRPEEITIDTPLRVSFVQRGEGDAQQTYLAFEKE
jgi:uncharacterized OB-fold protein